MPKSTSKRHRESGPPDRPTTTCAPFSNILYFATVLFGKDQAGKLLDMYNGSAESVLYMCSIIVEKDLAQRISKAQKRAR